MDARVVVREQALNGESPVWCERREALFWVDMRAPCLHLFHPGSGGRRRWDLPAWAGSCALTEGGDVLLALRTGLYVLRVETGALKFVAAAPCDARRFALNDGKASPAGEFHVGAMADPLRTDGGTNGGEKGAAPLWRWGSGGWRAISDPVETSNGLAWSPDRRTMYHSDTAQRLVWACDYDAGSGAVSRRRVFARVQEGGEDGGPDGAAVDREGFYWCAVFGGGCLLRYAPDGALERRVEVPVRYPTMPAFGGPGLGTMFVTSASWPIPEGERGGHPDAGCLLALEPPVPGVAVGRVTLPGVT